MINYKQGGYTAASVTSLWGGGADFHLPGTKWYEGPVNKDGGADKQGAPYDANKVKYWHPRGCSCKYCINNYEGSWQLGHPEFNEKPPVYWDAGVININKDNAAAKLREMIEDLAYRLDGQPIAGLFIPDGARYKLGFLINGGGDGNPTMSPEEMIDKIFSAALTGSFKQEVEFVNSRKSTLHVKVDIMLVPF
ncbi:hypothetical protein GNF76_25640 [Pseudomonas sp. CCM 7893]|uniref:Uncharacterized protein n=1 Tax=Pseudomonas spelaei TaxID=1055469 RepID=A0A6I3WAN3_9PSED|nr:hypothetical protein [Pseudomonas spelaei]MUF07740.1 hypothetical protein [Pseudomonas spelaei]